MTEYCCKQLKNAIEEPDPFRRIKLYHILFMPKDLCPFCGSKLIK